MIVDLGLGPDRGAGVGDNVLCLDRERRRDPGRGGHIRLGHALEELPRVGGNGFNITTLPFGIERVKGQGGFPGTGDAGDDVELAVRKFQIEVF